MLLLVPSRLELEKLVPEAAGAEGLWTWPGRVDSEGDAVLVARCGVGLGVSGVATMSLLAGGTATSVVLAGLAGSLDAVRAPVGSLLIGRSVALHGIGVGEGAQHRSLADAGGALADEARSSAGDLALVAPVGAAGVIAPLLSVTAGAASPGEAEDRRARHPACLAEDMESWAVARAAGMAGSPCSVLRGVSNLAGDRDHAAWRIDEAIAVLREALDALTEARP